MVFDTLQCKNCDDTIVFRESAQESLTADRLTNYTETKPLIVSCAACKHVYDYSRMTPIGTLTLSDPPPGDRRSLWQDDLSIACGKNDCEYCLSIRISRATGTTTAEVENELPDWVLHDLHCPMGHPIPRAWPPYLPPY